MFTGTVLGKEHKEGAYVVQFVVGKAWKGVSGANATVTTPDNDGACGYRFEQGIEYLVYAHGRGESLRAYICSNTQPVADAYEDLMYLGEGHVSISGQPAVEKTSASQSCPSSGSARQSP